MPPEQYLTTKEAAALLRVTERTLERWRLDGGGPPFVKLGNGLRARVLYRATDLHAWMEGQLRHSTAEYTLPR